MALSCSKAADTVVFGTIRTADEDNPVAEAVAVKDGKFIYVGDKAEILKKVDAALEAANSGKHCLFGFGWDMYKNKMTDHITLAELDAVSHGLSAALFDSGGHNMYCNTECLRRSGIIDDNGNVLIREIPGGRHYRLNIQTI